jgi:hypothetical protein
MFSTQAQTESEKRFIRGLCHGWGSGLVTVFIVSSGQKKCTDAVGAFLKAEKYSLGFEFTAR